MTAAAPGRVDALDQLRGLAILGVVAVHEPIACPGCQRAVMLLVNRGGSTRCVECDEHGLTPAGAPRRAAAAPPVVG